MSDTTPKSQANRTQIAAARRLYGAKDWATVKQGMELLVALNDPLLWEVLATGTQVTPDKTSDIIAIGGEIQDKVKAEHRDNVALYAMRYAGKLAYTQRLSLRWCKTLSDLGPLAGLSALTSLSIPDGAQVSDLTPLATLTGLTSLTLCGFPELEDLRPLAGLTALSSLTLNSCPKLSDLSPLAGLAALTRLDLSYCPQLSDITALTALTAMTRLSVFSGSLTDITPLAGMTALTRLELRCRKLTDITPLAGMTALTSLNLQRGEHLTDLAPLAGMKALESLNLSSCERLTDLAPLAGLTSLTTLDLHGSVQISDLAPLRGMKALTSLNLGYCAKLTDVTPLAGLTALHYLYLGNCGNIHDLTPLLGLTGLNTRDLTDAIRALQEARRLAALPLDRKQLAAVRKLYGAHDLPTVMQGMELLISLEDPALWGTLASGTEINARHTIQVGGEIHAKVKAAHRDMVALYAMRYSGKLNGRTQLKLGWGTDRAPLAGLSGITIT